MLHFLIKLYVVKVTKFLKDGKPKYSYFILPIFYIYNIYECILLYSLKLEGILTWISEEKKSINIGCIKL